MIHATFMFDNNNDDITTYLASTESQVLLECSCINSSSQSSQETAAVVPTLTLFIEVDIRFQKVNFVRVRDPE